MNRENISPLVQEQFPEFFKEDKSSFPIFLEKYYEYLESLQVHFTDLQLNEYKPLLEGETGILLEEGSQVSDDTNNSIILESLRNVNEDGFSVGEIVTGSTSHATAKVLGVQKKGDDISGHSDNTVLHHIFLKPLTGKFVEGEVFTGSLYRTTAKIKHFDDKGVLNFSRQLENMSDVFYTDSDYVELFRKEYLENIEVGAKADLKRLVSVSNEIFRTRGSEKSYNWLWKVLYNDENLEFEYPKDSLFKVSDANWKKEDYLIVNNAGASNVGSFSGRTVTGEVSGAIATVQSQAGFQRTPYELTKLFITDVTGNFQIGEKIIGSSVEGIQPTGYLLGVLDDIDILDGGTNYEIGDKLTISGGGGFDIEASVNTVVSGAINEIVIADGGDGYLGNETINYFVPSGGSGAASETRTIQQSGTAKIFGGTSIVNNFTSVTIDAANYGGTLDGVNANSHFHSNSLNTFDMTVGSTTNYAVGHIIKDSTNQITGTVVSVPDATSIIYVIEDDTKPNFYPGENGSSISAFKTDGSAVSSTTTTVTAVTSVTDSQHFGALPLTTETPYGTIKTIEILTTGSSFDKKPDLTVQQDSIILFENNDEILGERSRFLNFDSNIEGLFQYGAEIQGADSGASGTILDPYLENTSNTVFSTLRFRPTATLLTLDSTDGSSDAGDNILLEDGFHNGDGPQHSNAHSSYNASTSIAGQYRLEDSDFFANETIDVTVGSANAVSAASNTVSIDNSFRGRNAVMQTGNLATGSISSLTVSNFGVGYTSAPTVTADNAGDQNATFSATIGTLAEQPGGYTNESSLLSGKDKIQDSYYYQDYSYVLKTNTPINQFRDPVKTFVHPAGWALFGEIAVQTTLNTPFQSFINTEDNSRLIIELAAQNVNFLSTSSDVFEMTLRFIESSAAINVNSTYNQEYIYKFKDPGTGVSVSSNTSDKEYHKEVQMVTGQLVANPITSDNHVESSLSIGMTLDESNVTGERILYPFIGQTSFANERINTDTGDYLIRTTPSIQDWIDSFQVPDTNISNLGAYMSLVIGDLAAIEPKVANNSEIYLADINIALEDDNLLINSTDGSADDGDRILLEDGDDPSTVNNPHTATASGAIASGDFVVLNSDSTVSKIVSAPSIPLGTEEDIVDNAVASQLSIASNNNGKIAAVYQTGGDNYSYVVVGTVDAQGNISIDHSNDSVQFLAENSYDSGIDWNSNGTKFAAVIRSHENAPSYSLKVVCGSVSGTTTTLGTAVEVSTADISTPVLRWDPNNADKFVVMYYDSGMKAKIGSVSGTTITLGSEQSLEQSNKSSKTNDFQWAPDQSGKFIAAFVNKSGGDRAAIQLCEVDYSAGTISPETNGSGYSTTSRNSLIYHPDRFGSSSDQVKWGRQIRIAIDPNDNTKVVIAGNKENSGDQKGVALVAVANYSNGFFTTLGFDNGTHTDNPFHTLTDDGNSTDSDLYEFLNEEVEYVDIEFSDTANEIMFIYSKDNSDNGAYAKVGTTNMSTGGITWGSENTIVTGTTQLGNDWAGGNGFSRGDALVFDTSLDTFFVTYVNGSRGSVAAMSTAASNLTASNYLGAANGAFSDGQTATIQDVGLVTTVSTTLVPNTVYYIQRDGTLSTSADSPSVIAGTALTSSTLRIGPSGSWPAAYDGTTSLNGAIIAEAGRVLQEDELAPTDAGYQLDFSNNGKLVIHQSEDHKYMVTSVNSTAFTVQTQHDGQFLNTNLNEWNVEHKFADNIA